MKNIIKHFKSPELNQFNYPFIYKSFNNNPLSCPQQQITYKHQLMIPQNQIPSQNLKQKITFLRHAQSLSNKAVHDFREQRNLPDCWKTFHSIDDFNHKVIYNPDLCDCGISEKGLAQCNEVKQKLKDLKIDLILVSPLQRALETCQKVFGQRLSQVDVIVEPLLAESMKYSSDISARIGYKQERYPSFDFSAVVKQGDFWFLKNIDLEHQQQFFTHLESYTHLSYEQKQKEIARFMCLKQLRESNENVRKRVVKVKEFLVEYSKKYKNIMVVSHYYTIKHMFAKKIAANGEVLDDFHGPNCCVHEEELGKLVGESSVAEK